MNCILFDPPAAWENLLPLTFTRPVSELRVGILTIRGKWERHLGSSCSFQTRDYLQEKFPCDAGEDNLLVNGSVLPGAAMAERIMALGSGEGLQSGDLLLAARLDAAGVEQLAAAGFEPAGMTGLRALEWEAGEEIMAVRFPWDLFRLNRQALEADFEMITRGRNSAAVSESNRVQETERIFLEEGAKAEASSLNAGTGPIYLGKGAEIMEGSMVRGPFALCDDSQLKMGAKIYGPTTVGPHSRVGGEVNNSLFQGYSNKAHDGFLGQAVIGEWCNIGADSNNSNLKNNYAPVRLWNYREERFISTGLLFCGLIMGDHSKCGINTMFNTGTVIGVNANIFGDGFPRNFIPSFSWGGPQGFTTFKLEKAYDVAVEVMKRREMKLSDRDKRILEKIFEMTAKYRS